ncbi:hypothetical protein PAXRUDRAFT_76464, partial [Paxillus rubicundulus Ve08.2h10]
MSHTGATNRDMQEHFQHSADTIFKIFCHVLDMVVSPQFYNQYVHLPPNNVIPPKICEEPKLYPFFKDCWGAIDGTHIDVFVPDDALTTHYWNCK